MEDVRILFMHFKELQIQVEKANLLKLYYELEFMDDDNDGLNKSEYEHFLSRLDLETAAKFKTKTFEQMDKNNDGTIDLNEFQQHIDRIYKQK